MGANPVDDISVFARKLKERFRFPSLHLKLTGGMKILITVARSNPWDIFGELKTEAFYVADARETQAGKAKESIEKILGLI